MELRLKLNIVDQQGTPFMGVGTLRLLERIEQRASIAGAAREMNLSYVKALRMVNRLEACAGCSLLIRTRGGKDRGGTSLTPIARAWIREYRRLDERVREQACVEFEGFREKIDRVVGGLG
jgi:molybdate transport repressor ModE-like protein